MATILIVDDLATNRKLMKTLLALQGHRILEADDGCAALERIRAERPDLVVTDLLMPAMDGFELVRTLRADHELANTHVVFSSATYTDSQSRNLAASLGVYHFLDKPIEPEELLKVVDGALAGDLSIPAIQARPALDTGVVDQGHLKLLQIKLFEKIAELQTMNDLLDSKVQEKTSSLANANQVLQREIHQRAHAERDLEYSRNEQIRLKNEFFSHVSHELRGPLTAVHQFSTLLHDQVAGPLTADQAECTEVILRNIDQLRAMVNDLLEVTRTQTGKLSVSLSPTSLPHQITNITRIFSAAASAKGIQITTRLQDNLPRVLADSVRLHQVLSNILGNALKFTPERGSILLRAELSTDRISVQVHIADNGCGIPPADLPHIFDRLYQAHDSTTESRKGLGLGLYICQQLVQLQGGRIWASSELSHGTEISFSIPVFSISRQIAPIMESTAQADSVALFTVEISFADKMPDRMDQDDTALEVECILEHCMMLDRDVLLPLRPKLGQREIFYLVARADHHGAEALRKRILGQLERSSILKANGVGYTIAFEIMEFLASASDGDRLQNLAQITAAIEDRFAAVLDCRSEMKKGEV